MPVGPTVVFDGDNCYMAGVVAEAVTKTGAPITYVTESDSVSAWAEMTSERWRVRTHLMQMGVEIVTAHSLTSFGGADATLVCEYTGAKKSVLAQSVVMVSQRVPNDGLYHEILATVDGDAEKLPLGLTRIGDAEAPAIIAAAVYAGHRYATELDEVLDLDLPLKHDRPDVGAKLPGAPHAGVEPPIR